MPSIRARLTWAYAAAMMVTLVVFSVALLTVRRVARYDELNERVEREADKAVLAVDLARRSGMEPVIAEDDPLAVRSVSARMKLFLELLEG